MAKVLWVGDAACGSGFSQGTHHIVEQVSIVHEVEVIGVNYRGDPHKEPYDIYPAWVGGDGLGVGRLKERLPKVKPDVVVVQTNPWNVPHYMKNVPRSVPTIGVIAVEGKNVSGTDLNCLDRAIFWTEFGQREAIEGGMKIPSTVIPLGVDTAFFTPGDRQAARRAVIGEDVMAKAGMTETSFIVGCVNRNQYRKRIDLTIQYFARWAREFRVEDAYLFLHVLPGSSVQFDIEGLTRYYGRDSDHPNGIQDRVIQDEVDDIFLGLPEKAVREIYRCCDVHLSTALGEGMGLTIMESMACGVPNVACNYSAVGEWGVGAAALIDPISEGVMPDVRGMLGGIMSPTETICALDDLYRNQWYRERLGQAGYERVRLPIYQWGNIAQRYLEEIDNLVGRSGAKGGQGV